MNDELNKLYTALIGKGYTTDDLGDENTFRSMMSDKNNRKDLYDYVSERGDFRIGDYDAYEQRLTSQPIDKSQYTFTAEQLGLEETPYQFGKSADKWQNMSSVVAPMGDDIYKTNEGPYTRTEVPFRTIEYPTLGMAQMAARNQQREDALAAYRSAYNRLEAPGEVDERTLIEWGNNMGNAPIEQRNLYKRITGRDATNRVDLDAVMRSYEESKRDFEGMENSGDIAAYLNMPAEQRVKLPEAERRQYEEILEAKRRDEAVEGVNELHDRIYSLMEKQRISDVGMYRDYRENRSAGQAIKDAILAASVADTPQLQGIVPSSGLEATPEGKQSNEQNAALTAAGRKWNEMKYIINAAKDGNIFDGLDKALGSVDTWTSDQMLRDNMAIMRVANKFDREGEGALTDNEKALLDALALNVAVSEMYGDEISAWYKGGEMIGEMTPFMIEMMINPLSGLGKKAADKVTRRAIEKYGKKLVKDNAKKFALARGAAKIGAGVAGATGMALTTGLPAVGAGTQQRMLGSATYDYDNEGNVVYAGHKGGEESLFTAAREEVTSRMLDNVSEMLGAGYAGMPFKWLQKAGKGTKLLGWIDNLANSKFGKGVSRFAEKTKWNGPIEEFLEEVHVGLLNPVMVGDQSWEEFFTKDNLATIAIGVAVPGAAISTANTITGAADGAFKVGAQERWKMKNAEAMGYQLWQDNPNEWNDLTRTLMRGQMEDIEKALKEVYNNPNLTPEQKKTALEYGVYSLQWRTAKGVEEAFNEGKKFIDPMLRDVYGTAYAEMVSPVQANNAYKAMVEAEKSAQRELGIGDKSIDEWLGGRTAEEAVQDEVKRNAIKAYQAAKLDFEGRRDRFIAERDVAYMESDRSIDKFDNNGMVYATQYEGDPVYITGGNVLLNEDGTIDVNNSSETLYVKFPDGHVEMISPDKFTEVFTEDKTADLKAAKRAEIDQRWRTEFDTAEAQAAEREKREAGVVFNKTDAQGEHRIEILNEGDDMSDILMDGNQVQIPTEELNRWKQEAGIQTESAVADNATDNGTPTESEANVAPTGDNVTPVAPVENNEPAPVELPDVPDFFRLGGKNYSVASRNADGSVDVMVDGKRETLPAGTDYSSLMPTDKKGDVIFTAMPVERTHEYFVQKVTNDKARALMIEKNRKKAEAERKKFDKDPDVGLDPDKWEEDNRKWEEGKKAAQAKVDYWNEVAKRDAEITRSETREAVENIKPDVVEETADEFIANQLAGIKITPESFKRETGLSNAEQAQLVGVISNDGVSVERAAEIITENYDSELKALGFTGDMQDVRDIIIDVLSQGNPRSYARKGREVREAENVDQQRAEAEAWARGAFDMTLEELYLYEETLLPRMMRDYEGFDENEYYSNLAENNGYDTTRESESIGRSGELLQGEQPVPAGGTPVAGQRNEGGAVSDDVQGGGQNGVAQEEVPVNEPVGNSEQLSSSEIPNNQSVAEGNAPGKRGVDPRNMSYDERAKRGDMLRNAPAIDVNEGVITSTKELSARKAAEKWWDENVTEPAFYDTEIGEVEISRNSVESSLAHRYGQAKLDALTSLIEGFENAVYLGSMPDGARHGGVMNHYFVYPINYKGERCYVFCRAMHDANKNRLYVHEVFIADRIKKGDTLQTAASQLHGGIALYKDILANVLDLEPTSASEDRNSVSNSQENAEKSGEIAENGGERMYSQEELAETKEQLGELNATSAPDFAVRLFSIRPWGALEEANAALKELLASYGGTLNGQTLAVIPFLDEAQRLIRENSKNQKPRSVEEDLDNGDKRITNYNSRGEVATVAIERDGKVVSVDSYDEGVLFEHTEYDGNGEATSVTRYDKQGNVVGTQVYEDGKAVPSGKQKTESGKQNGKQKAKTPMQRLADRVLDRTEEKRRIPLRERARELEAQVGVKANIIESLDGVKNREARKRIAAGEPVAGWYSGGQVYLYMPNIKDKREIELTYVHEVVAHHGVKKLLGERFNEFLDGVWNMMSEADRARMLAYVGVKENPTSQDMRAAADEYVAELAEKMNLGELEQSTWDKIVDWLKELLESVGFKNLTKEDIESMLKASYSNLRAESGKGKTGSKENDFRARMTFHGSGAQFDRFDHAFMGTGEGHQAFGWGTYVTEVEGIGKQYAKATSKPSFTYKGQEVDVEGFENPWRIIQDLYNEHHGKLRDMRKAADYYSDLAVFNDAKTKDLWQNVVNTLADIHAGDLKMTPSRVLYSIEIPDDNGSNYLHWEDVVPKKVETAVKERLLERLSEGQGEAYKSDLKQELDDVFRYSDFDGASLYKNISAYLGGDKQASQFLNDMGFVGISYPAEAMTGGRVDGARNYVIFNENDAEIKDRTMFRKKDSERRQEKRRINDAIDTAVGFITVGGKKQATKNRLKKEAERKQLAKEMYSSVLKGDFNDVTLSQIDKFIEDATPANPFGRRISQRLPQRMERVLRQGARTNAVDALFSRICESTVPANERFSEAGRREIEERKKELLKGWAIATGNWHTDLKEFTDDTEPIGEGKDSKVYMSKDGNSVIKASKGKPFGKKFRPDIDNIPLFNDVFKNSRYEILGYGEIDGQFVRILKQDFIDFAESTPLTPEERKEYMGKLGFKPLNKDYTAFSNGEIVIADLQKSNIVKDAAGNISVIDADAKLHTKDVGGDYTYLPVEEDLPEDSGTRFRKGNPTLLGTHSITEDKLRKAIRMGGLANPSTAVFELGEEIPGEYGEITFVMPSSMVDKKTGRNTGAFAGDAWTPTYPQVERQMGKRGSARAREDVQSVPKEMQKEVRMGLDSWLDGREGAGLAYLFLQEEGLAPELSRVAQMYSDEIRNRVSEIAQGEPFYRLSPEQKQEIVDLFIEQYYNGDKAYYSNYLNEKLAIMQEKLADVNAKSFIKRSIQQYIDGVNEYGFDYEAVSDFLNKVQRDIDHSGGVNDRATTLEAARVIREKGLEREFQMWKEELLDRYEIKEVIFKGFTPTGNRRYVPHTLENVSKDMKEQGRNGAVGLNASFNKFAAGLLKPLGSLDAIRKRKGNLRATHADTEAFRDKWSEVYYDLAEKLQPDAKGYEDYGLDRVAEAATKKDPKVFIKSEYGIELSEADEKALKDMVWAIQNEYPVMYFETKFERPVYLDEFAGVVIPENTGSDVVESLENAGLKIETYEPGNEKARAEAIKRLTEEDDRIMFRITDADRQALEFKRQHRGSANIVAIDTDALTAELVVYGFTADEIQDIREKYEKGALGFYDRDRNTIYLLGKDHSRRRNNATFWHENTHKAIQDLDIPQEVMDEFYAIPSKRFIDFFEKKAKEFYGPEEYAEELIAYFVEDVQSSGSYDNATKALGTSAEGMERLKEIVEPVINYINHGRRVNEGTEGNHRTVVRGALRDINAEAGQERARTEAEGAGTEEARFRVSEEEAERIDGSIDDIQTQPLTLMERITNSLLEVSAKNKENLGLRADALKAFGRDINSLLSLMKAQREYDKSTVDTLVKLVKMYFKNAQLLGEVTPYEVARIMGVLNRSVGKRDISTEAARLMDILLDAHTNALAGILDKAEKVKAKKVNAAGVEVMGRLDKYGQKRVDEYRAAKEMTPEKLEEAIYDSDNRLAELEQRVREELGLPEGDVDQAAREYTGDNDVVNVYMDERARLEGLTLAREYKESIQQVQEEIKDLKRELKQAEEDYRLGNIDGKSLKEFRKSVAEAIMESKAELIEGYHSLIYKFQENTKESSKRAKAFAQAQIDRAREIQHNANSDMEGISAATQGTHPENYNNAVMNALRSPFPTLQGMLKKFGEKNVEGKGYMYERFIPQATKAGDNEFRGKVIARVMIEGKLKEIYGNEMSIAKFMKQLREYGATVTYREGNEMKQFDLTKGQMLYIYMVNKMSDGQMKLRRMGITDDVVTELMTKLPEEAVQFADWAQNELLKDLRGKYNAVHERVFGAPMAAIENYFPIKIRKEARGEKGDVSEVGQEGKPSTVTGSIIKRTKNATAIDLSADAMQVLMEHIDDMEHWAAFAEFNRDLNVLLNYKHFQNQVKNMTSVRYGSGTELWKNFKKTAQIVSGTYRPSDSSIDRAVQNIAKGLTRSKINFRLFTAVKQLLSAPAFWTDAGVEELAYCYVNPKGSFEWALENLPGFAERWQGRTMGNEKLLKSDSDWELWRNEFVEKATRWGMTPNAAIDALTVAQGARAVYMTKLEQFKKAGYTEQRANEKATSRYLLLL